MYFKRLELIGFKSFAEKTKLYFEPGVTAIVGPNGCGKSNLADGIKWVFGEQAPKSLRASRMEDVIFNGTDKKEPINLAEVSIVLSNESKILPIEYDEVTITRRLFRSGESEYLLNKTPVRLKDIQELIMGTGMGAESYSLIEQGQIDLILSSKPEERRYIFEEASGIIRYKTKKKEALNKLEHTENNLIRVSDIINEVKRQITSIERQAKKAERYKQEFEKLKDMDTKFSFFNYKNLRNEEKILSVEIEDIRRKRNEVMTKIAHFNEVAEKFKADIELISDKYAHLQATLMETSSSIDKNAHKFKMNRERTEELERSRVLLSDEIKKAEERYVSFEGGVKELRLRVDSFVEEKKAKEAIINQKEETYTGLLKEIEVHQKNISESKSQTVENMARQSKLNNETARGTAEIQTRSSRLRRLGVEKDKVTEELDVLESEFNQIDCEAKKVEEQISLLRQERQLQQDELNRHKQSHDALNMELANCQKEITLLKSQLHFLEELAKNFEGFDRGAKSILEAKKKGMFSRIDGPICNIIEVEKGFEVAVELTLDRELQSFIAETREQAEELLSYLEKHDLGRITIVVMNDLPKVKFSRPANLPFLTQLINVIKIDDKYKDLLRKFLRDVYVTEDVQKVYEVIKRLGPEARIVTKEGRLIQKGRICGGAKKGNDVSLVGRERRIRETHFRIEEFDKKVIQLSETIKEAQSVINSIEKETGAIVGQLGEEEKKLININTKKETINTRLTRLKDEKIVLETEIEELRELLQELDGRQQTLKKDLKESQEKQTSLENFIVESQEAIAKKSKQREELLIQLTQCRTELTSLAREEVSLFERLTREESSFAELSSSIESKKKQIADGVQRIKELEEENRQLELQNNKNSTEKERLEKEIEKIRDQKATLSERLDTEEQKIQSEKATLEQLRDDLHRIEVKKTEISYKQSSLREKILQAYKVDLDQMQIPLEEGINSEEVQMEIDELKAKLEKMGSVNLVAIEEHQELQERFNFLTHQQQDLLNAKDSLLKAIQKINKTTRSLFLDTFTKIQTEFRSFFRLLFGGGQAELLLLDDKDVLESGIEIIVRPPGKKLQNISLLSGGEKALTAIALLFAIFKVKPSPFCVLDEIDAPLDESNIGRFSNVLRDFLKISQFIIITHNKRTIELADVMYGITMEESGVSKIVSVKFSDAQKEKQKTEILT